MPSLLTWIIKPRSLPFLILALIFFALFLSLGQYDQFSTSFQLPPPPIAQLSTTELLLQQQVDDLRQKLLEICPEAPEPIYVKPLLTKSQQERYRHLQNLDGGARRNEHEYMAAKRAPSRKRKGSRYMLTTTIRQVQDQLPDLLNTILVLTMFLGPDKLSFSILEGPSSDSTPEILEQVLQPLLLSLGVPSSSIRIKTRESKIDFSNQNRIEVLAGLRNKAMEPLWDDRNGVGRDIGAVVFFNDVYMKARDVLELLHQHVKAEEQSGQETGITSGWDWYERSPAHYYDVWVGRTVSRLGSRFSTKTVLGAQLIYRWTMETCSTQSTILGGPHLPIYSPIRRPQKQLSTTSNPSLYSQHGTEWQSFLLRHSRNPTTRASAVGTSQRVNVLLVNVRSSVLISGKQAGVVYRSFQVFRYVPSC
jgi:hypothetical protein